MESQPVKLVHQEFGQGVPIVLLHGFSLDHSIWSSVVSELQNEARLILPDLRGHGVSPAPEGPYTMEGMAEDIVVLLDNLRIEKAILVGHSMGGYISQAFTRNCPDRLLGLAFVATRFTPDTEEKRQGRIKTIEGVRLHGSGIIADSMAENLTPNRSLVQPLHDIIAKTSSNGAIGSLQGMASRLDSTELIAKLQIPWVFVAGSADRFVPVQQAREMTSTLEKDRYFEVEGGGHMPMMEAPEVVALALRKLISLV